MFEKLQRSGVKRQSTSTSSEQSGSAAKMCKEMENVQKEVAAKNIAQHHDGQRQLHSRGSNSNKEKINMHGEISATKEKEQKLQNASSKQNKSTAVKSQGASKVVNSNDIIQDQRNRKQSKQTRVMKVLWEISQCK